MTEALTSLLITAIILGIIFAILYVIVKAIVARLPTFGDIILTIYWGLAAIVALVKIVVPLLHMI